MNKIEGQSIGKVLLAGLIVGLGLTFVLSMAIGGEEYHVVIYNSCGFKAKGPNTGPGISLKDEFCIAEHRYHPADEEAISHGMREAGTDMTIEEWKEKYKDTYKPLNNSFIDNLKESKLLYIGQYCGGDSKYLFSKDKYAEAIKDFLKNGGVFFIDYRSDSPVMNPFLDSIEVKNPSPRYNSIKRGAYSAMISSKDKTHILVNKPNIISGEINAYNWWERWSNKQTALFRNSSCPEKGAAMIIQEKVLGKGTIVFNQILPIFSKGKGGGKLLENILSYAYGQNITEYKKKALKEEGGPGEDVPW